jgi:hypothetical protein
MIIYCLQKTIAYGDGFLKKATKNSASFDSALSGRTQATRYAGGC